MVTSILWVMFFLNKQAFHEPSTLPRQVIFCRHAEKPSDSTNRDLSQKGFARAQYLADFFLTKNQVFHRPDIIVTFVKSPGTGRGLETMLPLIKKGNYKAPELLLQYDDSPKQSFLMLEDVRKHFTNKTVLICWEHNQIPMLVRELGDWFYEHKNPFAHFQSWSLRPTTSNKNEDDLFSLVLVVDIANKSLYAFNQVFDSLRVVPIVQLP